MLEGTLDEFDLTAVVRLIATSSRTGVLTVRGDAGEWTATFRTGRMHRLAQPEPALGRQGDPGIGALSLLTSEVSSFRWVAAADVDAAGAGVDAEDLLARTGAHLERLASMGLTMRSRLALAPELSTNAVTLDGARWRLLSLAGGGRSLIEIVADSHMDAGLALDAVTEMIRGGLLSAPKGDGGGGGEMRTIRLPEAESEPPPPQSATGRSQSRFSLALVCTGNRIRSPLAAAVFADLLSGLPVTIRSRGIQDVGALPPVPEAIELAEHLGLDISAHRSAVLRPGELRDFDLVLGFERSHVREAVSVGGAPSERSFTLGELADLLDQVHDGKGAGPDKARFTILEANAIRGHRRVSGDMPDPLGRRRDVYERVAEDIVRLSRRIAEELFGPARSPLWSKPRLP